MTARLLPLAALLLFVLALVMALLTGGATDESGLGRSATVYDEGPGGTALLRRYFDANGLRTVTLQSDRFVIPAEVAVLFVLGATAEIGAAEVTTFRDFVRSGGTLVVASDVAVSERPLLRAFGVGRGGALAPVGEHRVSSIALAAPPVRSVLVDQPVASLDPGPGGTVLAAGDRANLIVAVSEGRGTAYFVATLAPFLNATLPLADNGRLALALAGAAFGSRVVAFDEFHHGRRAEPNFLGVLTGSWPGRALLLAGVGTFAYLALSGRRLGPPLPLDARPPRSSLDYIRGFAGLARRSGHGEIARRRIRDDLRRGLARRIGVDPATPLEQVLTVLAPRDAGRAARASALDAALRGRLGDAELLRAARDADDVVKGEP